MLEPGDEKRKRIQDQLDRILTSTTFSGSERHRRFLQFVVEQALKGDTDKLNEFVLGFEVFNKNESFDPRIDSIVRVEARRLRERLKKYYQEEGSNDPVVVTLRPRSFVPDFQEPSAKEAATAVAKPGWREQLGRHKRLIAVAGAALLCGMAVTVIVLRWPWKKPALPQTTAVIVFPFSPLSPAAEKELLGERMSDSIITGLAGIPGLRIISRASGIQVQESGRSPYRFAAELHVDYIVEGTVRANGNRVQVSAKMTDTRTQSYVWAETRESDTASLAELGRELTGGIASRIHVAMPADTGDRPAPRRPSSPESYGAFLKGQYYWYQFERGSVEKSVELFEQALAGDPNYAPAWAWLSQSYQLLIMRDDGQNAAMISKGRQAASKALALDDHLAEAYAAVASYDALDWDWTNADRNFRRATELNPGWAQGHLMYALMCLVPTGRTREAMGAALHAHELDPLTRTTRTLLAEVQYFARDYPRAIAESGDLRKPGGGPSPSDRAYFLSLSLSGKGQRALAEMTASVTSADEQSPAIAVLGYLLAKHGDRGRARGIQQSLVQRAATSYVSPIAIAMVSVGLGDKDEAFRQLRTAVSRHVPAVCQVAADPVFDPLRSDPRYLEIVRQIGLTPSR